MSEKPNKYPSTIVKTTVYPEADKNVRLHDQKNHIGVGDNLVGRLKEGYVDKGIYMIPDHNGSENAMVLTGRIELNEQASFDDHNHPTTDRMVEVVSITPESVNDNGEGMSLHKWVKEEELAQFERLDMEENQAVERQEDGEQAPSSTTRPIGDVALRLVNKSDKLESSQK
ncbi:MAG TPA: hypothetical protein VFM68_04120 [Candidatus Saccharimonadales bacterium]|nr:hypothetical protein [Candidatus Saccharimonadales bacterium]